MPDCGLDKGKLRRLLEAIRFGMTIIGACGMSRISIRSLRTAALQCEELSELLAEAEGFAEFELLSMAKSGAMEDGTGAIKLLERRFPEWGRESKTPTPQPNGEEKAKGLLDGRASMDRQLAETIVVVSEPEKPAGLCEKPSAATEQT
jgi:hypothetical protein